MDERGSDAAGGEEPDRLDIEVALLAALTARDVGGDEPAEMIDLSTLTGAEKQTLLTMIKRRLEMEKFGTPELDMEDDERLPDEGSAPGGRTLAAAAGERT